MLVCFHCVRSLVNCTESDIPKSGCKTDNWTDGHDCTSCIPGPLCEDTECISTLTRNIGVEFTVLTGNDMLSVASLDRL